MAVPTSRGKRSPTSISSRRRGRRSAGSEDSHSRRISVGSVSYTISSCEVEDLPVDLLFYAHDGEDVYSDISKIKCLDIHHVNPWVICGDVDGRITVWDFQKQCELYRLENWTKSLGLQRAQELSEQTQPSSHHHALSDAMAMLLFWKGTPDIVVVLYDDRIELFSLLSKELVGQTFVPKFCPTSAVAFASVNNLLCIGCVDGMMRVFDRISKRVVDTIETPCKSITHLIEINGVENLFLSIDKSGPVHLWNFQHVCGKSSGASASGKTATNVYGNVTDSTQAAEASGNRATTGHKPVCELVDSNGKHLHQPVSWATFSSSTGELVLCHKKNKNYFSFDLSRGLHMDSTTAFDGVLKCQNVYTVTSKFVHGQHLNHPAFPATSVIGFRSKQATVEIIDLAVDHAIELFDLRHVRKNLPSKLKIYALGVQGDVVLCGTNVGLFAVNLWTDYNIPKVPLSMTTENIQQLLADASFLGGGGGVGPNAEDQLVQSPLLSTALEIKNLPRMGNDLLILYWPLLRNYSIVSSLRGVPAKDNRMKWGKVLSAHSKCVAMCTVDGDIPIALSLTTERIVSLQVLKKSGVDADMKQDTAQGDGKGEMATYAANGPQGIYVIPEQMDEGVKLHGGGPLAILTFRNNTSTFLEIVEEEVSGANKAVSTPQEDATRASTDEENKANVAKRTVDKVRKYTLQPVGPRLPLIHLVQWSDTFAYCAVACGTHVHIFSALPKFRHRTTISLAMGGPGANIHLSSGLEGRQCKSMLWHGRAIFLLTKNFIYLAFPFNTMSGESMSLITLASRDVPAARSGSVFDVKRDKSDTLHPEPIPCPIGIGSMLSNVSNVYVPQHPLLDGDQSAKCCTAALVVRVAQTKDARLPAYGKGIFEPRVEAPPSSGTSESCIFYPVPLCHPMIKFKLLVASNRVNEALSIVDTIDLSFHDHLSTFLCGHGHCHEAIVKVPGLSKSAMLNCILSNKAELRTELPRLIQHSVLKEQWMIRHIAVGLAEEKNLTELEKYLEMCMKNKLWDSATFIASFLPRHLQMKTAGIIARQERKRVKNLRGNMDGVLAMAKVTTIAKYRPKFSSSSSGTKSNERKYKSLWSKMPSTDSLRRAWNEELDKNLYFKDNSKVSRTLSVREQD